MKRNKQKHVEKQATKPNTVTEKRRQEGNGTNDIKAERRYKDTVFRMLFQDKTRLLSLYNAVNGSHHVNPEDLQIVTLENAIYMSVKNDLAFIVDLQLHLYEHQSTVNPNMPLRFLQYISKEYEKLIDMKQLYKSQLLEIPTPKFIVFYNGAEEQQERQILRLSNAFLTKQEEPQLELQVEVLNINEGYNEQIKEQCKTLEEYMQYVDCVRREAENKNLEDAVTCAVNQCIKQGILSEFLLANKAEVVSMSIFEYDADEVRKMLDEEAREIGYKKGWKLGMELGMEQGMEQGMEIGMEQGMERGIEQGTQRLLKLIAKMSEAGEADNISRLSEDADFLQEMYEKYSV